MRRPDARGRDRIGSGSARAVAQQAEQFTRGARRFRALRLEPGLADQRTQLLAIGAGMPGQPLAERVVAFGEETVAPAFDLVQGGGLAARFAAVVLEHAPDRLDDLVVEPAHLLGEELRLPLARDLLGHRARAPNLVDDVGGQRQAGEHGIGQGGEFAGQFEDGEGIAALLAATGAVEGVVVGRIDGHRDGPRVAAWQETNGCGGYGVTQTMTNREPSLVELDRLAAIGEDVLKRCRAMGASEVDLGISVDEGLNVGVRLGEVESIERTRDRGLSLTVFFGKRKGSASTADLGADSIAKTIEHACAIARHTEEDPCNGLADPDLLAREFPDLDLWHPWPITTEQAVELALACEDAGRAFDARIDNSEGASVQVGSSIAIGATSHGFFSRERDTRHMISVALLAEDEAGMQRDYWYEAVRAAEDFPDVASIGRKAAERTLARLGARPIGTRQCPVLFTPPVARSLVGHFLSAVSGGALYRRASFLLDHLGQRVFPDFVRISERPHLRRGHGSSAFVAEGVATRDSDLIRDGVLQRYILGSYSARKLGMSSTGNAGGVHNVVVTPGAHDFAGLVERMGTGLVVTELMGQGASLITGDYSRGASGFWVENGAIAHPVEEITIASNLRDMFAAIEAVGSDVDRRSHILTGSILVGRMTVAGS